MKELTAEFILGATKLEECPKSILPEVAFSGRSNVGKSTLLNSIIHKKNLAHTSATPGKTRQINFYNIDEKWMFADLPGFGYAAVSKTDRAAFLKLNMSYLEKREQLRLVCLLVDSRHDPMELDLGMMEWLETHETKFIVILTKCDKISPQLIIDRKEQIEEVLGNCKFAVEVLPFSAVTNLGRQQLFAIIKRECSAKISPDD